MTEVRIKFTGKADNLFFLEWNEKNKKHLIFRHWSNGSGCSNDFYILFSSFLLLISTFPSH